MSTPRNPETVAPLDAIQSALNEIVSAQSSLNMPPERIEPAASDVAFTHGDDRPRFLSETDANAAHTMEHLHAAFMLLNRAQQAQESLKTQVYRLVVQIREAGLVPKVRTWLDEDA